jgi:hypothetical protein
MPSTYFEDADIAQERSTTQRISCDRNCCFTLEENTAEKVASEKDNFELQTVLYIRLRYAHTPVNFMYVSILSKRY